MTKAILLVLVMWESPILAILCLAMVCVLGGYDLF